MPEAEASGLPTVSSLSSLVLVIGSKRRGEAVVSVGVVSPEPEPELAFASSSPLLEDIVVDGPALHREDRACV